MRHATQVPRVPVPNRLRRARDPPRRPGYERYWSKPDPRRDRHIRGAPAQAWPKPRAARARPSVLLCTASSSRLPPQFLLVSPCHGDVPFLQIVSREPEIPADCRRCSPVQGTGRPARKMAGRSGSDPGRIGPVGSATVGIRRNASILLSAPTTMISDGSCWRSSG